MSPVVTLGWLKRRQPGLGDLLIHSVAYSRQALLPSCIWVTFLDYKVLLRNKSVLLSTMSVGWNLHMSQPGQSLV